MIHAEVQPHTRLSKKDITPVILVAAGPGSAEYLAKNCDEYSEIAYNRSYRSFKCVQDNQTFLVCSHGVGSPSAGICFEELIYLGAKIIIRAGTVGSLDENVLIGDIVLCEAAVRADGFPKQRIPMGYPSVADFGVTLALKKAAKQFDICLKSGITLSCDAFYTSKIVEDNFTTYSTANVASVGMEESTLFIVGRLHGIKTAALCCVDGHPKGNHSGDYDPTGARIHAAKARMSKVARATCVEYAKQFSKKP